MICMRAQGWSQLSQEHRANYREVAAHQYPHQPGRWFVELELIPRPDPRT